MPRLILIDWQLYEGPLFEGLLFKDPLQCLGNEKKPVIDDIGAVHEPPGGGAEVGITGSNVDLEDRALGEAAAEEDGGVSTRGRTVTLRDYMAFYLFTRSLGSFKLFLN